MDVLKTLEKLTSLYLPSPGGKKNTDALAKTLSEYADNVSVTRGGSVIITVGSGKKRVLVDAHHDEVCFIVSEIKGSFVKIIDPFGADVRVLPAGRLTILGEKPVAGVCFAMPPHLLKDDERGKNLPADKLCIDTGLPEATLKKLVFPGAPVCYPRRFEKLENGRVAAAALDDRIGCLLNLMLYESLKKDCPEDITVDFAFASEEERSGRGAETEGFGRGYSEALAFDVTFATDPAVSEKKALALGSGAAIGVSPILDRAMSDALIKIAVDNSIPHTVEVMGGRTGTDCDSLSTREGGIKTALVSVPIRSMHTPVELCDPADIDAAFRLCDLFLRREAL